MVTPSKGIAVYAGSFDPITLGHIWMIAQGSSLFDTLIVAIGENPEKANYFSLEDRLEMITESTASYHNIQIDKYQNMFLMKYAASVGAKFILRGIRNPSDYEYEKTLRYINGDLNSSVTSVFLMPPREIAEVSSSTVLALVGPEGWESLVGKYVPACVMDKLKSKKPSR